MWRTAAVLAGLSLSLGMVGARGGPAAAAAVADVPTYAASVTARASGGYDVAYRTATGAVALRGLTGTTWTDPSSLGGRLVGGPAITYAAGALHVYGRGTDSALWRRVRTGSAWGAWTKIGGLTLSSAPAAVGRSGGRVDVFARDAYDQLRTRTYRPGTGWGAWTSLGGRLHSAPSAALAADGSLRVAGTGTDSAVWTRTLTGSTWSAWTSLGGRTYAAPAVSSGGSVTRLFIRDAGTGALHARTLTGGTWQDWQALGGTYADGPAAAGGDPAVVLARGADRGLYGGTLTGSAWSGASLAWTPGSPPAVPSALLGTNVTRVPTTAKVAALTFDCAWSNAGTESIRATLQRRNVPASFFFVGDFARGFPAEANLLVNSGFRVGNHSDHHPDFTTIDDATARTEVTGARTTILGTTGTEPRALFRFPYGAYTASDVTLVNGLGYVPVGWSVDSLGWKGTSGGQTTAKVTNRVLAAAKPGMIVLMHVGANPDDGTTLDAAALPGIITGLRDRGYTFTTLDALFP